MNIFFALLIGMVAGIILGWLFGSRVSRAALDELRALRSAAANAIKPKG